LFWDILSTVGMIAWQMAPGGLLISDSLCLARHIYHLPLVLVEIHGHSIKQVDIGPCRLRVLGSVLDMHWLYIVAGDTDENSS